MRVEAPMTPAGETRLAERAGDLVAYGLRERLLAPDDALFAYNRILAALRVTAPASRFGDAPPGSADVALPEGFDLETWIAELGSVVVAAWGEDDVPSAHDRAETALMALLIARPSEVNRRFQELRASGASREEGAKRATDYLSHLSLSSRYVRAAAIARNLSWTSSSPYGPLEITINLSKPEKDPVAIAAALSRPATTRYPTCALCQSNEGYEGRPASDPAGAQDPRQNLRIVDVELGGETWGLQYSPYAYFTEHCICMSRPHRPMHVDRENIERLLDFVDAFPHYFIGSNADLPICGGSILSHDHFQGGRHTFPMMNAEVEETFALAKGEVEGAILRWPLSVVRLRGVDREALLDEAARTLALWRGWSDASVGLVAKDEDGTPHHTITPVARRLEGEDGRPVYELFLALRSNLTSPAHPLGIFHPHEEYHHIKKENIGLIEVMGLAILPPRLKRELAAVGRCFIEGRPFEDDPEAAPHAAWAYELLEDATFPELSGEALEARIREGVGEVFCHVLEDCGVFKQDAAGRKAFRRFIAALQD